MEYKLNKIVELCSEHGFKVNQPDENRVDIVIYGEVHFMTGANT